MGLKKYLDKRDFTKTPEPKGRSHPNSRGHQFIIQKHAASRLHYDLRLEMEGVLKSWAVPKGPSLDPAQKRLAVQVEDHPLEYGSFEGLIPEGQYGGGTVLLWDRGEWSPDGDPLEGYARGRLRFRLEGEKLHGSWSLVRMGRDEKNWLLVKRDDEEARPTAEGEITEERGESVSSGRTLEQIAADRDQIWGRNGAEPGEQPAPSPADKKQNARRTPSARSPSPKSKSTAAGSIPGSVIASFPKSVPAQLAALVKSAPTGENWFHEIKFDGYRILAFLDNGRVRLVTRNGKEWTDRFAELAEALARLGVRQAVLDGEVVALSEKGGTDFQLLQNALTAGGKGLVYYAFDLLYLDGQDLRGAAAADRTAALEELLSRSNSDPDRIRFSTHFEESGPTVLQHACDMGLEGIISKRRDAPYRGARTDSWVKTKCVQRQEFVIGGYTEPAGSRIEFGALLVGVRDSKGRLVYSGQVGTGFTNQSLRELGKRLRSLKSAESPFEDPPTGRHARGVTWVRPELVAEVEFTEWTRDQKLRHPSFQGLREDKPAEEIVAEKPKALKSTRGKARKEKGSETAPAGKPRPRSSSGAKGGETEFAGVRLTSPDKLLYAEQGLTKLDLARHYQSVADRLLPHVKGRPLLLVRCPSGARRKCFIQRHAGRSEPEEMHQITVLNEGKPEEHLAVRDSSGLIALAQIGALEVHAWSAWPDNPDSPDRITFDLDPGPDTDWKDVVEAARRLRDLLSQLGLEPFVKTTGGRGLHVVTPLAKGATWDEAHGFSRAVAQTLVREAPDRYIATMSKARRKGKIFIDYLRNARAASVVAPYSPRAREGAPVSVPVEWEELGGRLRPDSYNVKNLPARLKRLKSDPWENFEKARRRLTSVMRRKVDAG